MAPEIVDPATKDGADFQLGGGSRIDTLERLKIQVASAAGAGVSYHRVTGDLGPIHVLQDAMGNAPRVVLELHPIAQELRSAALAMTAIDCQRVRAMGLFNPGLYAVNERHHPFGTARITDCGGGLYDPDPDGKRALIVPVYDREDLVDLVAFHTATPEHWLLRLGIGWALGLEDGLERYRWGDPLPIHKTPLDWLKTGCAGICVIDWDAPEVLTLADFPTLLIGDDALERRMIAALTKPSRLPHIAKELPLAA